jgi:hypothetical protein
VPRAEDGYVGAGGGARRAMKILADEGRGLDRHWQAPPGKPLQRREEGAPDGQRQRR